MVKDHGVQICFLKELSVFFLSVVTVHEVGEGICYIRDNTGLFRRTRNAATRRVFLILLSIRFF